MLILPFIHKCAHFMVFIHPRRYWKISKNLVVKGITHFSPLFKHNLQCVRKGRESLNGLKENVNVPLSHFPQTQWFLTWRITIHIFNCSALCSFGIICFYWLCSLVKNIVLLILSQFSVYRVNPSIMCKNYGQDWRNKISTSSSRNMV